LKFLRFLRWNHSIGRQISVAFIIPLIVLTLVFIGVLYQTSMSIVQDHVITQFELRLKLNMENLVNEVNEDLVAKALTDKAQHQVLVGKLNAFTQEHEGLQNAYVIAKVDGKDVVLALSNDEMYLEELPFTAEQNQALQSNTQVISEIYEDDWGVHKSLFVPYAKSNVVIGIDMDASFVKNLKSYILMLSVAFLSAAIVVGGLIAFFTGRKLSKPIIQLMKQTKSLTEGDLRASSDLRNQRQDELGQLASSYEEMRQSLSDIIHMLRQNSTVLEESSTTLQRATSELSNGSKQVAHAMTEEANATDERASHLDTVAQMIRNVTESAGVVDKQVADMAVLSAGAQTLSHQGNEQVRYIEKQMQEIRSTGEEASSKLKQLDQRTKEISNVIGVIRTIASQINMLSLNATIEAARAGEHGKGFTVVAQEIQKLAKQTNDSVTSIIESVEVITTETVLVMETNAKSSKEIAKGVQLISENGRLFEEIRSSVSLLAEGVAHVREHTDGIAQSARTTLSAVNGVLEIADQSVASQQEIAATFQQQYSSVQQLEEMSSQTREMAQELAALIQKFKV